MRTIDAGQLLRSKGIPLIGSQSNLKFKPKKRKTEQDELHEHMLKAL